MSQGATYWLEWLTKVSLPVVAVTLMGMYVQAEKQALLINSQTKDLNDLKAELIAVKATYVTKIELLETLKRVDQQLEIVILRSKIKQ